MINYLNKIAMKNIQKFILAGLIICISSFLSGQDSLQLKNIQPDKTYKIELKNGKLYEVHVVNINSQFVTVLTKNKTEIKIPVAEIAKISIPLSDTYKIELYDGTVFVGDITKQDSAKVVFTNSTFPSLELSRNKIKSIEKLNQSNYKEGKYWFTNPNSTRYLFGPSAFNLKKGEGYYQNTYAFLNSFNIGITNNISIGGGVELLSTFGSITSGYLKPIFIITPKLGFKVSEKFHAGAGVLFLGTPGIFEDSDYGISGIAYGVGTYGTLDNNFTGGLGWGFIEGEFSARPIITVSAMQRISQKTAFVTENWIIPDKDYYYDNTYHYPEYKYKYRPIFSYGIRFFGEKLSIDIALINNKDIAEFLIIGIPYVDFVVKF